MSRKQVFHCAQPVHSIAISPDGQLLAVAVRSGGVVLLNARTGETLTWLIDDGDGDGDVSCVAFSHAASSPLLLATGSTNGVVQVWNCDTRVRVARLWGVSPNNVDSIAFSPDGRLLASAQYDSTVRLWETDGWRQLLIPTGDDVWMSQAFGVSFSRDSRMLASYTSAMRVWHIREDVDTASPVASTAITRAVVAREHNPVRAAFVVTNAALIAADVASIASLAANTAAANAVTNAIAIIDAAGTGAGADPALAAALSAAAAPAVAAAAAAAAATTAPTAAVHAAMVAIAPVGDAVRAVAETAVTDANQVLYFTSIRNLLFVAARIVAATSALTATIALAHASVHAIASALAPFAPATLVPAAPAAPTTPAVPAALAGPTLDTDGLFLCMVFSPTDNTLLACGDTSKDIVLARVRDGSSTMAVERVLQGHRMYVRSLAFSPGGERLASASVDCTVRLWNVASGACLRVLRDHTDSVSSVTFFPNGVQLAAGSWDKTVRIWITYPWSDRVHYLFGAPLKAAVFNLMCVRARLEQGQGLRRSARRVMQLPRLPMEVWLLIFGQLQLALDM